MTWISLALFGDEPLVNATAAGWTGTISFGGIVAWLLGYHIPNLNKDSKEREKTKDDQNQKLVDQMKAERERHDGRLDSLVESHKRAMEQMTVAHKQSLEAVVAHCEKEMQGVTDKYREDTKSLVEAIGRVSTTNEELHQKTRHQLVDLIHVAGLKAEIEKRKKGNSDS